MRNAILSTATFLVGLALQLGDFKLPPWLADCVLALGVLGWYYSMLTWRPVVTRVAGLRRKAPLLTMILALVIGGMFGAAVTAIVMVRESNRVASAGPLGTPPAEPNPPATEVKPDPQDQAPAPPAARPEPRMTPEERPEQDSVPTKRAPEKKETPMPTDDGRAGGGDTTYGDRSPIVKGDNNIVVGGDLNLLQGPRPPKILSRPLSAKEVEGQGFEHQFRLTVESDVMLQQVTLEARAPSVFGEIEVMPVGRTFLQSGMISNRPVGEGHAFIQFYNAQGDYIVQVWTAHRERVELVATIP